MAKPSNAALHAELVAFALALPGAFEDHPWGEIVAKVAKKVFVFFGTAESRAEGFGLCVKLPQSGSVALGLPFVEPAGYGLGKSGWVYVRFPKNAALPAAMFKEWILESYRAVAPKTLAKQLVSPARPEPPKAARTRKGETARAPASASGGSVKKTSAKKRSAKKSTAKGRGAEEASRARAPARRSARRERTSR